MGHFEQRAALCRTGLSVQLLTQPRMIEMYGVFDRLLRGRFRGAFRVVAFPILGLEAKPEAYAPFRALASEGDGEAAAAAQEEAAAQEATVLPGLSARLRTSRMMTPLDFRDRLDSYRGAGFSLEPILFQSAWFRPNNRSEEVEGLYLVGAGTHPGAGLPGVLSTAKVLEHLIPHAPRAA